MINPATANGESQVGMVEKEKKEKERDFRYRVAAEATWRRPFINNVNEAIWIHAISSCLMFGVWV